MKYKIAYSSICLGVYEDSKTYNIVSYDKLTWHKLESK